jgi:hypothetical protein
VSEQGDFGLNISSGLIRHRDGTFGYVLLSFTGRDDVEPVRKVLSDESDAPVSFFTEREAQIAAFDWIQDYQARRDHTILVEASARLALSPWGVRAWWG